jgi:hypothetical protein
VFSVFWYGEQQASKQVRNRKQDKEGWRLCCGSGINVLNWYSLCVLILAIKV